MNKYISNQKIILEKAAKLVYVGGNIIYIVDTANKKESTLIIEEFLKLNPNFSLLKQRQTFFDEENISMHYYAILRRES